MGFRFQKRIRIFKGLTLNLSKSGSSWTLGRPGASVNLRRGKVTGTVGIPGTGLSYRESVSNPEAQANPGASRGWGRVVLLLVLLAVVVYVWAQ